jgi:signal transduction histidine kinase
VRSPTTPNEHEPVAPGAGAAEALEAMVVRASRGDVQQHVLGGLLHDLNGPLNNIALTLALVSAGIARQFAAAPDPAIARLARQVATLEAEVARLADSSQAMGRVLQEETGGVAAEPVPLDALVVEVRRRLRHHAALHDIVLDDAVMEDKGAVVRAERESLQLALSALLLGACGACRADARISIRTARRDADVVVTITARPAALPADVQASIDAMVVPPPPAALNLAAGRLVAQNNGGLVTIASGADHLVIDIAFRRDR